MPERFFSVVCGEIERRSPIVACRSVSLATPRSRLRRSISPQITGKKPLAPRVPLRVLKPKMTAARVVAAPFMGLKGHRSEKKNDRSPSCEMTKTVTILLHKELLFLNFFYVKTVMPLAFHLLFQNWYL